MMVSILRCLRAEYQKCKHSALLFIHLIIPVLGAVIFASYCRISNWEITTKISGYLEVLAVAFPFLVGIIVGMVVQIENQAGRFQLMLGTIPSRSATYIGKQVFLLLNAMGATVLALGLFAILYRGAPAILYVKAWGWLVLTVVPIYQIHLLVGMNFGKGASVGLGIFGSLAAALMITGLGDRIWRYFPWAWGVRAMDSIVLAWDRPDLFALMKSEFENGMMISAAASVCLLAVSLIWFQHWEGGKASD